MVCDHYGFANIYDLSRDGVRYEKHPIFSRANRNELQAAELFNILLPVEKFSVRHVSLSYPFQLLVPSIGSMSVSAGSTCDAGSSSVCGSNRHNELARYQAAPKLSFFSVFGWERARDHGPGLHGVRTLHGSRRQSGITARFPATTPPALPHRAVVQFPVVRPASDPQDIYWRKKLATSRAGYRYIIYCTILIIKAQG